MLLIIFKAYWIYFWDEITMYIFQNSQNICTLYSLSKNLWISVLYIIYFFFMYVAHLWWRQWFSCVKKVMQTVHLLTKYSEILVHFWIDKSFSYILKRHVYIFLKTFILSLKSSKICIDEFFKCLSEIFVGFFFLLLKQFLM